MTTNHPTAENHLSYLREALKLSEKSPPKPTNFRVGALLVSFPLPTSPSTSSTPTIISSGYTLELPGNTHAEQCALSKLASEQSISESDLSTFLTPEKNVILYTTLEPCGKRLSGSLPCVQRIIATRKSSNGIDSKGGIRKVIFGAKEPGTFVQDSQSCQLLDAAGVDWEYIPTMEEDILKVAMAGHVKDDKAEKKPETKGTNVDDISEEERKRQEAMPRNPKKRMMEGEFKNA